MMGGLCDGLNESLFFPEMYNDDAAITVPNEVVLLCDRCPFKDECLAWAMSHDAYGFWAGTSRFQRLQMDRKLHRVRCPGCASDSVVVMDKSEICLGCGISWMI